MNSKISGRKLEDNRDSTEFNKSFDAPGIDQTNDDMTRLYSTLSGISLISQNQGAYHINQVNFH